MICPRCGSHNEDGFRFCMKCGYQLSSPVSSTPLSPLPQQAPPASIKNQTIEPTPGDSYQAAVIKEPDVKQEVPSETVSPLKEVSPYPVEAEIKREVFEEPQRVSAPPPVINYSPQSQVSYSKPVSQSYPQQQQYSQPPMNYANQNMPMQQYPNPQGQNVYGSQGTSSLNIWGPFAGLGERRRYSTWLMDNRGDRTEDLIKAVTTKFKDRQIPQTRITREILTAKGIAVENRPFFLLKRGLTTIGVYIAQFGKDLFISSASYLKPPISTFKVILAAFGALITILMMFVFPSMVTGALENLIGSFGYGGGGGVGLGLLCVVGFIGGLISLAFSIFLVFSLYKYFKIKDFMAGLRSKPNEFNEDDLMAMDKAVEQTIRQAIDEIGLDNSELKKIETSSTTRLI